MARWYVQYPGAPPVGPVDASELQAAWARQQIPPNTMVCAEGFAQWVPFHSVAELVETPVALPVATAGPPLPGSPPTDRRPTRATAVVAGLAVVPFIFLVVHTLVFGRAGAVGPAIVPFLGIVGAIVVGSSSLRLKTPGELLRNPAFGIPVGLVFIFGEGMGIFGGLIAHIDHTNIAAALANSDPCVIPSISAEDVKELIDEPEKRRLEERSEACETRKTAETCAKLAAAIDRHEKTLPAISDGTTADVARRLATGDITAADLALTKGALACDDAVWMRLVRAAAKTPVPWAGLAPPNVSEDMTASLASARLSPAVQDTLRARAELAAKAVLQKNKTDDMQGAKSECDQTIALKVEVGQFCKALAKRFAVLAAREEAAAAADERRGSAQRSGSFKSCLDACRDRGDTAADVDTVRGCVSECGEDDFACLSTCRLRHGGGTQSDRCALSCNSKFGQ